MSAASLARCLKNFVENFGNGEVEGVIETADQLPAPVLAATLTLGTGSRTAAVMLGV